MSETFIKAAEFNDIIAANKFIAELKLKSIPFKVDDNKILTFSVELLPHQFEFISVEVPEEILEETLILLNLDKANKSEITAEQGCKSTVISSRTLTFNSCLVFLIRVTEQQLHIDYNEQKTVINLFDIGDIERSDLISLPVKLILFIVLTSIFSFMGFYVLLWILHSEQVRILDKDQNELACFPISTMKRRSLQRAL